MTSNSLRAAQVLWPSFMMAGVLEMLVFSVLDPSALSFGDWYPGATTVYSLAFFVFWGITMASSALTTLLSKSPFEVNRCPVPDADRPLDCARNGPCC